MTLIFQQDTDPHAERFWDDLESALMAAAIAHQADLRAERIKALRRLWLRGTFNAFAVGPVAGPAGGGKLEWITNGEEVRLHYTSPRGLQCHLARVYRQPDDSFAAIVVAVVANDPYQAMATAEWAIARLTA